MNHSHRNVSSRLVQLQRRMLVFLLPSALLAAGLITARASDNPQLKIKHSAKPLEGASLDAKIVHQINARIADKWKEQKLIPSPKCSDNQFIRRATLDIIGRIATPKEIRAFLRDQDSTRRARLIERLLKSEEYARNWANIWTVWLLTRGGENDPGLAPYHEQMHAWLETQFAKPSMSYKDLVSELLTASGRSSENPAVNFILSHLGEPFPPGKQVEEGKYSMVPITSRTTRLFLGMQIQCAQCHVHPFNKERTQKNFWGINAFFRQVDTPRGRPTPALNNRMAMSRDLELHDNPDFNRESLVLYEQRNGTLLSARPEYLDGTRPSEGASRRQELAGLITNDKNFPRAYVNRLWGHFFGRGFTNPIDDFGPENEPTHPELLDELAQSFAAQGYDTRRLIRWICNSDAYQLASGANRSNEKPEAAPYFSRMLLKAMTPEQLFESLITATQAEMFESKQKRAELRKQWLKDLTTNFGDDEGNEVTFNGTVVQALLLMNGGNLNNAIASKDKGTVAQAVEMKRGVRGTMDQLYLAALNRLPTPREAGHILDIYQRAPIKAKDGMSFWQDLFWALLNSNEFILNH
jgi:Protein of unknown function (DUF1549)/Protein of unknown function (DUF1553)